MVIFADGKRLDAAKPLPQNKKAVIFVPAANVCDDAETLGMQNILMPVLDESAANRFESHRDYDCLQLNIPDDSESIEAPPLNIDVYHTAKLLVFVHDPSPVISALQNHLDNAASDEPLPYERVLPTFFNLLTAEDAAGLEQIEEEIATLEDMLAMDASTDYIDKISILRKRLLKLKRYYESLFDAFVDMEENENGLLSKEQLRHLHIVTNRADRLQHSVLNLRDYVTQVRESYQAQLDISLNQTMRLFTVISAIFMPLTLIAGWYGMNLAMPEFNSPYSYPIVIVVSIAIAVGCLVYFKRKKWF